ncbi:MAG TPA: TIGR02234 family membrane protein [Jatrophihabitantaceae bacterium]|jgi:uncharacterized membrane protein (TIGR02234 family)|nr:TIGR02234 family membrane protein [Jatrophihabitantaceae bacterium]
MDDVRRGRGEYGLALLLDLIGAGAALLISTRHWQSVLTPRPRPFSDDLLQVAGRTVDAAPTALALVALAGVIAVLATKSWPRRVVGVVVALAGVGLIWRSLTGLRALSVSRARALVQDKHPGIQLGSAVPQVSVHSGWAVLSCVCGVVVLLAGVLVASRGHRWGGMSAKYDAPVDDGTAADRQDSAEDAERARLRADASLWSALDRGDDPTNHNG